MKLYFYFLDEQAGRITEQEVEVVKTAKTYKTADGDPFPETGYRRYSHDDAGRVHKHLKYYYLTESRDMEAAKEALRGYFRFHYEQAREEARRWENRLASVS